MSEIINSELNNDNSSQKPLRDEVTKKKIEKHLKDITDTISEDDLKNINTSVSSDAAMPAADKDADEVRAKPEDEIEDKSPKKEMPNTWDIIDEK